MMTAELSSEEKEVLRDLAVMTYEQVQERHGWSRGRIYALALRTGARKNEQRIRERALERRQRQQEMLTEMLNQTVTADALDYLAELPSGSVNMVLTSPPYNVSRRYLDAPGADNLNFIFYMGWLTMVVSECARILKEGGVLFLQVGSTKDENGTLLPIDMALHDTIRRLGLTLQSRIVWTVPHGLTPKSRLSERYEVCLVASKGAPACFNATAARTPQKQPGKRAFKGPNKGNLSGHPLGAWPSNVWSIGNVGANHPERTGHPAQMPEELVRRAIHLYTNPGDLVVDPFSGSGTTHKVAIETGRNFSGSDLHYSAIREERLKEVGLASICPLPGVSDESIAIRTADARSARNGPDEQFDLLGKCA